MYCRKITSAILGTALLFNAAAMPAALAAQITGTGMEIDENYDPFAEEQAKQPEEKLTMRQKIAQMMEEKKAAKSAVEGVADGHVYIPKGTLLKVELIQEATSKTLKKYQPVEFKMVDNLIVNGVVVIPKDTVGIGYVYEAQKAGGFGRKGVLRIAGYEIKTINNIAVPLKKGLQGQGNTDGGAVAVAAAVSLVGGLFMKGTNITYPAGTDFEVEVKENVDLNAVPENLAEVMDPEIPHGIEINVAVK